MDIAQFSNTFLTWNNGIRWLNIFAILAVGLILYKLTSRSIQFMLRCTMHRIPHETKLQLAERQKRLRTIGNLFAVIIKFAIAFTTICAILNEFNINLAPIIAGASVLGVALGFGAQNIVKDCLAGFFIILENQYRVGDYIIINGVGGSKPEGSVTSISLRRTALRDHNGNFHFISNSNIYEVINRTMGYSQFHFTFAVESDTAVDSIVDTINKVGEDMAKDPKWRKDIIEPPHYEEFGEINANSLNVHTTGTCMPGRQWRICAEFKKRLIVALQDSDINIADVKNNT